MSSAQKRAPLDNSKRTELSSGDHRFWGAEAQKLEWFKPYSQVIDLQAKPVPRWFVEGEINTCYNAVDRHVEAGRGEQTAIQFDSAMTGIKKAISYRELKEQTAVFAGAMAREGVTKGDRVLIYMPMVPEALIAMLACARLGAVHSVVFGGFAAAELATRIDDAKPKLIITASCGLEPGRIIEYKPLLDSALRCSTFKPSTCVVLQRPEITAQLQIGLDIEWSKFISDAESHPSVPLLATDPLYILHCA